MDKKIGEQLAAEMRQMCMAQDPFVIVFTNREGIVRVIDNPDGAEPELVQAAILRAMEPAMKGSFSEPGRVLQMLVDGSGVLTGYVAVAGVEEDEARNAFVEAIKHCAIRHMALTKEAADDQR